MNFSCGTKQILRDSGWTPNRRVELARRRFLLAKMDLVPTRETMAFYESFDGLTIDGKFGQITFRLDEILDCLDTYSVAELQSCFGSTACPIAYGRSVFAIHSGNAESYILHESFAGFYRHTSIEAAIESLLWDRNNSGDFFTLDD